MSFPLAEALSWAVAGELLLTTPGPVAPLYPDTMEMYDNLWLQSESGVNFATMNRLGGSLPDGSNIWELASRDPRLAADQIRRRDEIPHEKGSGPHADLAFRIAYWLLEAIPLVRDNGESRRKIFALGNFLDIESFVQSGLPREWLNDDPRWLHALVENDKEVGFANFKTGEYQSLSHSLSSPFTRSDGTPACPLGYELGVTPKGEETFKVFCHVRDLRQIRRNYMEEGFEVTTSPLFSLGAEAEELDSMVVHGNPRDNLD